MSDSADLFARRAAEVDRWGRRFLLVIVVFIAASFSLGFQRTLSALVLVGFGASILGLRLPIFGILGVTILCTLDAITRPLLLATGGLLRWNTLNYWLLIVILVSCPLILRMRDPHTRVLHGLVIVVGLGVFFSPDLVPGLQHTLGATVAFALLVYFVRVRHYPGVWYWLAMVSGTLSAFGCLSFVASGNHVYVDRNAWSFFPLTGLVAICMGFHEAGRRPRGQLWLGALAATNIAWIFLSTSRGGFFIAVGCALFLLTRVSGIGQRIQVLCLAAFLALILANQFSSMSDRMMERLNKMFDSSHTAVQRTSGRSDLALAAWYLFQEEPISGVGTGGFAASWAEMSAAGVSDFHQGSEIQAHSGWAKTLAENGIIGIVLHVAYVFSFALLRRNRTVQALGLLVAGSLSVAFLSTEFQNKTLWFFATGVTVLAHYVPWGLDERADGAVSGPPDGAVSGPPDGAVSGPPDGREGGQWPEPVAQAVASPAESADLGHTRHGPGGSR